MGAAVGAAQQPRGAGAPRGAVGARRRGRLLAAAAAAGRGGLRALHPRQPEGGAAELGRLRGQARHNAETARQGELRHCVIHIEP